MKSGKSNMRYMPNPVIVPAESAVPDVPDVPAPAQAQEPFQWTQITDQQVPTLVCIKFWKALSSHLRLPGVWRRLTMNGVVYAYVVAQANSPAFRRLLTRFCLQEPVIRYNNAINPLTFVPHPPRAPQEHAFHDALNEFRWTQTFVLDGATLPTLMGTEFFDALSVHLRFSPQANWCEINLNGKLFVYSDAHKDTEDFQRLFTELMLLRSDELQTISPL